MLAVNSMKVTCASWVHVGVWSAVVISVSLAVNSSDIHKISSKLQVGSVLMKIVRTIETHCVYVHVDIARVWVMYKLYMTHTRAVDLWFVVQYNES